ncbi:MAG: hypothetical protein Q7T16_01350 [Candidatus Burarchaeum sp.]|nr:hypothetical protein [Candidatus Burarchaeum sp.]MDO8339283.1 hypothetical protein [Candidatus Burarchaeum sp.]
MVFDVLFGGTALSYDAIWTALALFAALFILAYIIGKNREAVMDAGIAVGFADALWAELKGAADFKKKGRKRQGG